VFTPVGSSPAKKTPWIFCVAKPRRGLMVYYIKAQFRYFYIIYHK
jgi:hypothetical protein